MFHVICHQGNINTIKISFCRSEMARIGNTDHSTCYTGCVAVDVTPCYSTMQAGPPLRVKVASKPNLLLPYELTTVLPGTNLQKLNNSSHLKTLHTGAYSSFSHRKTKYTSVGEWINNLRNNQTRTHNSVPKGGDGEEDRGRERVQVREGREKMRK